MAAASPAASASSVSPRARPGPVCESPPRAARPSSVPATAPATPARAPLTGRACRPVKAQPPAAPMASRTAKEGGMRRSGANGILSPAISAKAAIVANAHAAVPPGMKLPRVRPSDAAQVRAAQADRLRIPATNPSPNEAPYPCITSNPTAAPRIAKQPHALVFRPAGEGAPRMALLQPGAPG